GHLRDAADRHRNASRTIAAEHVTLHALAQRRRHRLPAKTLPEHVDARGDMDEAGRPPLEGGGGGREERGWSTASRSSRSIPTSGPPPVPSPTSAAAREPAGSLAATTAGPSPTSWR